MKIGLLRTRVARRILALFIACALAPTTALAVVAYVHVRWEMIGQADVRLRRDAKTEAMRVLERLVAHSVQLGILASSQLGPEDDSPNRILELSMFRALARVVDDEVHPIAGALSVGIPALTPRQLSQLNDGGAILVLRSTDSGAVVLLGRSVYPSDSSGAVLWGETAATAMMGDADTDGGHAACLFAPAESAVLSCLLPGLANGARSAGDVPAHEPRVTRSMLAGEDRFVATWPVFLGYEFAAPDWRVVASDPASEVLGGLARFRTTFMLVTALSLIVVFLLSNVQIRRSTAPLERLAEGTRRVAAGDFSNKVDVKADDEFGALADSFNAMASELRHQFASLSAMEAIDRAALQERSTTPVVHVALDSIARSLGTSRAVIALAPLASGTTWTLRIVETESGKHGRWRLIPPPLSLTALAAEGRIVRVGGGRSPHDWLVANERRRTAPEELAVLPLLHDDRLLGILAVTLPQGEEFTRWSLDARRLADRLALALSTVRLVDRLDRLSLGTLTAFARAIDANSPWTAGHSERVTAIAMAIGRRLALGAEELATLQRGGLLHDIGKIGIPPAILDKPELLSDTEIALVREHPMLGVRILAPIEAFADVLPIVRHHHERMDGAGYPDKLRGGSIPFLARLLAVADVYDALTSDRPYRTGWSSEAAAAHIVEGKGTHFDPKIVASFLEALQGGDINAALSGKEHASSLARAMEAGRQALTVPA